MSCKNRVSVFIARGFSRKEIKVPCGSTSTFGTVKLCPACLSKAKKKYPQGWRHYPGDTCKHGIYLNSDYDCNCGRCEIGE